MDYTINFFSEILYSCYFQILLFVNRNIICLFRISVYLFVYLSQYNLFPNITDIING